MDFSPYKLEWSEEDIEALGVNPDDIIKVAKSVRNVAKKLGKLGLEVYITPSHMSIMGGPTHSNCGDTPHHENVVANIRLDDCINYDVGDW